MMKALDLALSIVKATGEQIDVSVILALENNANQKHFLGYAPYVRDASGESAAYFKEQSSVYRMLATQCKQRGLVHGVEPTLARSRV